MLYYRTVGCVPPKRHVAHRKASGERLVEELMGAEWFSHESSLVYHRNPPSVLVAAGRVDEVDRPSTPKRPARAMAPQDGGRDADCAGDFVDGRQPASGERWIDQMRTDENAVMADTFCLRLIAKAARPVADASCLMSWSGSQANGDRRQANP